MKNTTTQLQSTVNWIINFFVIFVLSCISFSAFGQTNAPNSRSKKIQNKISKLPLDLSLAIEWRSGFRTNSEQNLHERGILNELRTQVTGSHYGNWFELNSKVDLGYDFTLEEAIVDLRDLSIDIYPHTWWSLKIGRQVLTWGKGDFLFINDLFPKDFPSFFSGRDIQYLKAPNNAIKLNLTPKWLQVNIIYVPKFDPDRFLSAERISFFDVSIDQYRGVNNQLPVTIPDQIFSSDEWHLRLQKTIGSTSLALYAYDGYWKSPAGYSLVDMAYDFPSLSVYGASIENPFAKGILVGEFGYYRSKSDREGIDPLIRNSELRFLLGFSRDIKPNWNFGIQFYCEYMLDYDAYLTNFNGGIVDDQFYDLLIFSIRKTINKQRTEFAIFSFHSFKEVDGYLRPNFSHKINDFWKLSLGMNLFYGKKKNSFWNQLALNNNVYLGIKWNI